MEAAGGFAQFFTAHNFDLEVLEVTSPGTVPVMGLFYCELTKFLIQMQLRTVQCALFIILSLFAHVAIANSLCYRNITKLSLKAYSVTINKTLP